MMPTTNATARYFGRAACLRVTRSERDALQRLVIDVELGRHAVEPFALDPADPRAQGARRRRTQIAFSLLDDLGWTAADARCVFDVTSQDVGELHAALLEWAARERQALVDARTERAMGECALAVAERLVDSAAKLAAIGALLAQLGHRRTHGRSPHRFCMQSR